MPFSRVRDAVKAVRYAIKKRRPARKTNSDVGIADRVEPQISSSNNETPQDDNYTGYYLGDKPLHPRRRSVRKDDHDAEPSSPGFDHYLTVEEQLPWEFDPIDSCYRLHASVESVPLSKEEQAADELFFPDSTGQEYTYPNVDSTRHSDRTSVPRPLRRSTGIPNLREPPSDQSSLSADKGTPDTVSSSFPLGSRTIESNWSATTPNGSETSSDDADFRSRYGEHVQRAGPTHPSRHSAHPMILTPGNSPASPRASAPSTTIRGPRRSAGTPVDLSVLHSHMKPVQAAPSRFKPWRPRAAAIA